jgi:hypothetical protein
VRSQRIRSVALASLAILVAAPVAQALISPERVLGRASTQDYPFVAGDWLAFAEYDHGDWDAFVRNMESGVMRKVNPAGTQAAPGGFDPDTDHLIFGQWTRDEWGIYIYDVSERTRRLASGVNAGNWQFEPRISSSYISYFKYRKVEGEWYVDLFLYDRAGGTDRRLDTWRSSDDLFLANGSVGDRYATWTACRRLCAASVYDSESHTLRRVPAPEGRSHYAPVVDEVNGRVYFVRSGQKCGAAVDIWRLPVSQLGSEPTKIVDLPDGIDAGFAMSLSMDADETAVDLFFERWDCERRTGDIYVARGVDAA